MNNENEYYQESSGDTRPIIFFNDTKESLDNEKEDQPLKENTDFTDKTTINRYLATCIISILIYLICAWGSKIAFTEVIDLELPLVILLTLLLTSFSIQGYSKLSYITCAVLGCVCYYISPAYAFMFSTSLMSNIIYDITQRIYFNKKDYSYTENYTSNMILSYVSRMKYYVILSLFIFIIFVVLGYFFAGIFQPIVLPSVEGLNQGVQQGTIKLETMPLFLNNFSVAMNMIMGGLYFSTMTIYLLIFNALVIGYTACITDLGYFLSFTLPHGIIELFAIVLAGASGFRVTHSIFVLITGIRIKDENRKDIFIEHVEICCKMLVDVLIMIIIIAILLIIAAFIEANLTIPIGKGLYDMIYLPSPV